MARFEQRQRLAIRDEIVVLIDDARATHRAIKTTVEADRLKRGYPGGGLSRDQIELSIIDVAGVADVVVELGGQNGQEQRPAPVGKLPDAAGETWTDRK